MSSPPSKYSADADSCFGAARQEPRKLKETFSFRVIIFLCDLLEGSKHCLGQ